MYSPQVDKTTLSEEDNVTARRHGEAINLGLNVYDLFRSGLEICNVDFNIEVSDAASRKARLQCARETVLTCKR